MMPVFVYLGFIISGIIFLRFIYGFVDNNGLPQNWPFVGMIPTLLVNIHRRPHDKLVEVLNLSNGTFFFKGLWFANTNFLITTNPENVHYILSSNSSVYLKGHEWLKQFDIFGEGIFNSDGEAWSRDRKASHAFLNHQQFKQSFPTVIHQYIEERLVKVLEYFSRREMVVDLQDLFARYAFDIGCIMGVGFNPNLLSIEFPENRFHKAMSDAMEAAFYRYALPDILWKLQSWLQIGKEKKRSNAWKTLDDLLTQYISMQRRKINQSMASSNEGNEFSFMNCYLTGDEITGPTPKDSLIRDKILSFLLAGVETYSLTLTWFFYLISQKTVVENNIREEIKRHLSMKEDHQGLQIPSNYDELSKLTYLDATLCETLRLCPPVPFEFRTCTKLDSLPSGHRINQNARVVIGIHAMGRMESVWGEDCNEFKPERWITEEGKIKRESPSKFCAFIAGPKMCPGKELSFLLMKAVITTIIHNYDVQVIEGQSITPKISALYQMKNGLMARLKNRYG